MELTLNRMVPARSPSQEESEMTVEVNARIPGWLGRMAPRPVVQQLESYRRPV